MKTRLPKALLTALLGATTVLATTQAATTKEEISTHGNHVPVEIIDVAAGTSSALTSEDASSLTPDYLTNAKDGKGTSTVDGNITRYHALMVREGKLVVNKGASLSIYVNTNTNQNYRTGLSVAGKDSEAYFDSATLKLASSELQLSVGGGSGNGTLTFDNGCNVNLSGTHLVTLGDTYWVDGTYVSDAAGPLFRGNYVTSDIDGKSLLGKGVLNILNGSVVEVGSAHGGDYGNFWMSEGELNVIGAGSKLVCYNGEAYRMIMNEDTGSTSVINVKDGGEANLNFSVVQGNFRANTRAVINVDGENSVLTIGNNNYKSYEDVFNLAARNLEGCEAIINVTNGGHLNFNSTDTIMSGAVIPGKVKFTVDAASSTSFHGLSVYNGAIINNAGDTSIETLTLNGGEITNTGSLTVTNALTFTEGSIVTIVLTESNVTNAAITLGSNAIVTAEKGATVNLTSSENVKAGTTFILLSDDTTIDDLTITGLEANVSTENGKIIITVANDSIVKRDPQADVLGAAAWGVQKSSQAFTGTLWGGRTNAVILNTGTSTSKDEKGGLVSFSVPTDKTLAWGTAYGQFSRIDSCCDATGADFNIYGGALGVEHQFVSGSSIGAAIGYDWGKVSPFRAASVDQWSMHAAVYGRAAQWILSPQATLALDLSAAVGQTESELPEGDVEQDSLQLDARVSYIRSISDKTSVSAFAGLQYYAQGDDATANVEVGSAQYLRTLAGMGINHDLTARITLFAEASVYNDAMRHNPEVMVDGFSYGVANPGRLGGSITVGASYDLNADWTLRGSYSFDGARHSTGHSVNAGATYKF